MKLRKTCLLLLFVVWFFAFANVIEVNAMNTGFSTEEISEEMKNTFVSNIGISLLMEEPTPKGILCFDVNEKGMIAIGQEDVHGKEICVYTTDGNFLYGYTFNCSQSFGVEWDNEHINIFFVRSDIIISLDSDGNILDVKKVQNTIDNNTHSNALLYSTSRIVGDTTYLIRNDMGIFNWLASSYSQIIAIDPNGVECIIYDINTPYFLNAMKLFVIILMFVFVVVAFVFWKIVKLKHRC